MMGTAYFCCAFPLIVKGLTSCLNLNMVISPAEIKQQMKPLPATYPGEPILGNIREFMKDRQALLRKAYQQMGPIFTLKLGPKNVAVLIEPSYQQFFFMETDKSLSIDKPYENLKATFGEVAFLASPEVYYEQRPILHSPFGREKMMRYYCIMQAEVQKWLDGLGERGEIEITSQIGHLVQQVAGNAFLGGEIHQRVGRAFWEQYNQLGKSLDMVVPPYLPTPKNIKREIAKIRMRRILEPIITERRNSSVQHDDFLQDFITTPSKSGSQATDEEIFALLRALMFASHETTAGQAAWTIIEILRHPGYEDLVRTEVAKYVHPNADITGSILRDLEYVAWAVQEIERLHPSADVLMRVAEQDIEVGDCHIPKGLAIMVAPSIAHRIPELFKDPDTFDPLRFAPDRQEDRQHRFAMIGFGGGVHKCAGMNFANNEMMIITALIFQQFDLELLTPDPKLRYGLGAVRPEPTILRYTRKHLN